QHTTPTRPPRYMRNTPHSFGRLCGASARRDIRNIEPLPAPQQSRTHEPRYGPERAVNAAGICAIELGPIWVHTSRGCLIVHRRSMDKPLILLFWMGGRAV